MGKDDDKPTPQQWLMYAGAAGAAAGAAAVAFNGESVEKLWKNDVATEAGSVGRKFRHLSATHMACAAGCQAMVGYEKPSAKMLALNGGMWVAHSAVTGAHTFNTKSMKKEVGCTVGAVQLAMGAAMIGRAIWMEKNKDK